MARVAMVAFLIALTSPIVAADPGDLSHVQLGGNEEYPCDREIERLLCETPIPPHVRDWIFDQIDDFNPKGIVCIEHGEEVSVGVRLTWDCFLVGTRDTKSSNPEERVFELVGQLVPPSD